MGCGGDRDAGKRPQMGEVAGTYADMTVLTDDNPRSENGDAIIADMLRGMSRDASVIIERDRGAAIEKTIREAADGDVVLVAGKGHEPYQETGGVRRRFSDALAVRAALRERAT